MRPFPSAGLVVAVAESRIQALGRVVGVDADRDPADAVSPRALVDRLHQAPAEPSAAPARDDGDRKLGGLRVDVAVAVLFRREEAVPLRKS
jgi:hypothetical protein